MVLWSTSYRNGRYGAATERFGKVGTEYEIERANMTLVIWLLTNKLSPLTDTPFYSLDSPHLKEISEFQSYPMLRNSHSLMVETVGDPQSRAEAYCGRARLVAYAICTARKERPGPQELSCLLSTWRHRFHRSAIQLPRSGRLVYQRALGAKSDHSRLFRPCACEYPGVFQSNAAIAARNAGGRPCPIRERSGQLFGC